MAAESNDSSDLHQEPLEPFSGLETALSIPRLALGAVHLSGWLGVFLALDKAFRSGQRFDRLGKFVCRCATRLAGIRVRQHGLSGLSSSASYVFCINHVSMLDLFVVFQSIPYFHRSFQHASHFRIPIYGGCVRVFGQLPVDRNDKALNQRSFAKAVQMLQRGESFVVFPEGHRTRDGKLGNFYPGAFRLAAEAGVAVVPVALRGLRNLSPAGDWRVRPGQVDVIFGRPIPTANAGIEALATQAHRAVNELLVRGPAAAEPNPPLK